MDEYLNPNSRGGTHIYRRNGDKIWTKVGTKIEGEDDNDQLGSIVSLSKDGSVVATAAASHKEIYQMIGQDVRSQLGSHIVGPADTGSPVAMGLSTSGTYIAVVFNNFTLPPSTLTVAYKHSEYNDEWKVLSRDTSWFLRSGIVLR